MTGHAQSEDRGDVHDRPAARLLHAASRRLRHGKNARDVGLQNLFESVQRHVERRAGTRDASVVDENVERRAAREQRRDAVGRGDVEGGSERVEALRAAFAEAGLTVGVPDDMRAELWDKFLFIVPFAGLTTLTRAPIGPILASPELTATLADLLAEAAAVAKADGVDFGADVVEKRLGWMRRLHPGFKSSMQRDLERGKPLEIDALAGAVVRLGEKYGVPTPVTRCVHAVLALEDRRARDETDA